MAAAMNGMALHGGVLPVGGTFLVFADYCRPAIRLAAHLPRPGHLLLHPRLGRRRRGRSHAPAGRADRLAARHPRAPRHPPGRRQRDRGGVASRGRARRPDRADPVPTGPPRARGHRRRRACSSGAHVIRAAEEPDIVLVASGSEVHVALAAAEQLAADGIHAQVTSLACWELFAEQAETVQDEILPPEVPTLSVEAATSFGWDRWADDSVAIDRFGASAPGDRVLAELGFTPEHVAERARRLIRELEEPS